MSSKGKDSYEGLDGPPLYSPLKCSKKDGRVCQFPYKLRGEVKWDCADEKNSRGHLVKACNVEESSKIQSFQDISTFHECGECQNSTILADGNFYSGFGLANNNNHNFYGDIHTKKGCQILCDITPGCNFFSFNRYQLLCYLKYGTGIRGWKMDVTMGYKSCRGTSILQLHCYDGH